jgi:polar amino acid transport system substrate-binding protein
MVLGSALRLSKFGDPLGCMAMVASLAFALACPALAEETKLPDLTKQTQLGPSFSVDPAARDLLPEDLRKSGKIAVALATGIAPLNFPGDTPEKVRGLTPDLASALSQILGVSFGTIVFPSTAAQLLALDSGQIQLTISTNGDTPERQQKYDFVDYIIADNSIVVAKGNPLGIKTAVDICGKAYGEVKGAFSVLPAIAAVCEKKGLKAPALSSFDDAPSMMLALISRRVDAYAGSSFNTIYQQSQGVPVEDMPLPEAGSLLLGITVSKSNPGITKAVAAAMKVMVADGYYKKALEHWGLGKYAIDPGVNLAK